MDLIVKSVWAIAVMMIAAAFPAVAADKPQRIVSLNLCTDQLLMMLVEPKRIAAVSYLARRRDTSALYAEASRIPITHGQAEEVFTLQPDLVLAGKYTRRPTVDILKRLGERVEEFDLSHSFADIRANLRRMGDLVGERDKAEALIAEFDADLKRFRDDRPAHRPLAALYYANAYTAGGDTLAGEMLEASGMRNLGAELGLKQIKELPLEVLVMANPELVVKGRSFDPPALAQEVFEHPALKFLQKRSQETVVADKYAVCGTPFVLRVVSELAEARKRLITRAATNVHGATREKPAKLQ